MAQYRVDSQEYLPNGTTIFETNMLADKNGNIINSFGNASNIPIAAGQVVGYSHINKFGFNPNVGTGFESVTDVGGTFPTITTAAVVTVSSDASANGDDGLSVELQGLDANYNLQTEVVAIAGATVTTSNTYIRLFRATVQSTNTGELTLKIGTTVIDTVEEGAGQTLMAVYTVPAGKTAYLIKFQGNVEKDTSVIFRLMVTPFGGSTNIKGQYGSFGSPVTYDYPIPLVFTEKTDIEIQVKAQGTTGAGAIFDLILVDNA
jgi:hypothetical protein